MKTYKIPISPFFVLIFLFICVVPGQLFALAVDNVTPNWGQTGEEMEVAVQGSDFDNSTRLSMILDLGNRGNIIGSLEAGDAKDIVVVGDIAYVVDNTRGLMVVDIENPANPSLLSVVDIAGEALEICVSGNVAYVLSESSPFLTAIDISDPARSSILGVTGSLIYLDGARGISVVDGIVYVINGQSLMAIDMRDPLQPAIIGSIDELGWSPWDIIVSGNILYVVDFSNDGLRLIDISNPAQPVEMGFVLSLPKFPTTVAVAGTTVYMGSGSFLYIVDASDANNPVLTSSLILPLVQMDSVYGITVSNNTAYLIRGHEGLLTVDVSNPMKPVIIATVATPVLASGVSIVANMAYVADGGSGLQIIDITNIVLANMIPFPAVDNETTVVNNVAYVPGGNDLQMFDMSEPLQPVFLGVLDIPGVKDVVVVGSLAYVISCDVGLQVVDVSNPAQVEIIATVDLPYCAEAISVVGEVAYVVGDDSTYGMLAINVSNPDQPFLITPSNTNELLGNKLTIVGSRAYIARGSYGLQIVDISVPDNLQPFDPPLDIEGDSVEDVDVVDNTAFVLVRREIGSTRDAYLKIYDVSDPTTPIELGKIDVGKVTVKDYNPASQRFVYGPIVSSVTVINNVAHVTERYYGLVSVDVSDPAAPVEIGSIYIFGSADDVTVVDTNAFVSVPYIGLVITPVPLEIDADRLTLESSTKITATLPSTDFPGHYTIRAFNDAESNELPGAVTFSADFSPVEIRTEHKAIIVAGYGPHSSNWLWDGTQRNANHAYNAMKWQGYTDENIYYLSDENVDINGDGILDVDADANLANLEYAITTWAADAYDLVIYLVDHGGTETFQIKFDGSSYEVLQASTLADWLNSLQEDMPGRLLLVYEACYSGSFLQPLKVPAEKDYQRILFASSAAEEKSQFLLDGRLSFSYQFWTVIYESADLAQAFNHGRTMMEDSQTAWLDADGDGEANTWSDRIADTTFGRGYKSAPGVPYVSNVQSWQAVSGTSSALLWAEVQTMNPITKVWAVIVPPDYDPSAPDTPDVEVSSVNLSWSEANQRYEADFTEIIYQGSYAISYYAMDDKDGVSLPRASSLTRSDGPDIYEDDDQRSDANVLVINDQQTRSHTIHDAGDEDWLRFYAIAGESYAFEVEVAEPASSEMYAYIEIYTGTAQTPLDEQHSIGLSQPNAKEILTWTCTSDGIYYIRIHNFAPLSGSTCMYTLRAYHPTLADYQDFVSVSGLITANGTALENARIIARTSSYIGTGLSSADGSYSMQLVTGTYDISVQVEGYDPRSISGVEVSSDRYIGIDMLLSTADPDDLDGDNIADDWEITHFGNTYTANGVSDWDRDGYSDLQEYLNDLAAETDPTGTAYDPQSTNAPDGTGYAPYLSNSNFWNLILPAILGGSR